MIPNAAVALDFDLAAGRLDAGPRPLSARVDPGESVDLTLTPSNTGGANASSQVRTAGTVLHAYPSGLASLGTSLARACSPTGSRSFSTKA